MRNKFISKFLSTLLLIITLISCQKEPVNNPIAPIDRVTIRVASINPGITELLLLHSHKNLNIVGRSEWCDYPKEAKKIPIISNLKPNYEKLLEMKPDIILYDKMLHSITDIQKLHQLNFKTIGVSSNDYQQFEQDLLTIEKETLGNFKAKKYLSHIYSSLEKFKLNDEKKIRVCIFSELPTMGNNYIAGKNTFLGKMIAELGAELVGPNSNQFELTSLEYLLTKDIDTILVATKQPIKYIKDTLNILPAVKNNCIHKIDPDLLLRLGGRIPDLIIEIADKLKS